MKIEDLMVLIGKSREQVEDMLNAEEPMCLKLTERKSKEIEDRGSIEILG